MKVGKTCIYMGKTAKASNYFLEGQKPAYFFLRGAKAHKNLGLYAHKLPRKRTCILRSFFNCILYFDMIFCLYTVFQGLKMLLCIVYFRLNIWSSIVFWGWKKCVYCMWHPPLPYPHSLNKVLLFGSWGRMRAINIHFHRRFKRFIWIN